jgi:hypothetical protein
MFISISRAGWIRPAGSTTYFLLSSEALAWHFSEEFQKTGLRQSPASPVMTSPKSRGSSSNRLQMPTLLFTGET